MQKSKMEYQLTQFKSEIDSKLNTMLLTGPDKSYNANPYATQIIELQKAYSILKADIDTLYSNAGPSKGMSEKYNALFAEIVRIGKEQESQIGFINEIKGESTRIVKEHETQSDAISKIRKYLDDKFKKTEQQYKKNDADLGSLENLNNLSTQLINQYAESNDEKVKTIMRQLQDLIGKYQLHENSISTLDNKITTNLEKFNTHIANTIVEINAKFKLMEQESTNDRQEIGKYIKKIEADEQAKLETYVAAINALQGDIIKHENAFNQMTANMESYNKAAVELIKKEETVREQQLQEITLEMKSNNEYKMQLESFKERIAETIKLEFDSRQANESLSQDTITKLIYRLNTDLPSLKESIEKQLEGIKKENNALSEETSAKLNGVSQYIDTQVSQITKQHNEDNNKIKASVNKSNQQFKDTLQRIEENRAKVEEKMYQYCKALASKQNDSNKTQNSILCSIVARDTMNSMLDSLTPNHSQQAVQETNKLSRIETEVEGVRKGMEAVKGELEALSKNVINNISALNEGMIKLKGDTKAASDLNNKTA